jgi:hypothetical protein
MRSEGAGGIDKSLPVVRTGLAEWRGDFEIFDFRPFDWAQGRLALLGPPKPSSATIIVMIQLSNRMKENRRRHFRPLGLKSSFSATK